MPGQGSIIRFKEGSALPRERRALLMLVPVGSQRNRDTIAGHVSRGAKRRGCANFRPVYSGARLGRLSLR